MKKTFYILMLILIMVILLTGCGPVKLPVDGQMGVTGCEQTELPPMGEVYITVVELPNEEYSKAQVRVANVDKKAAEKTLLCKIKLRGNSSKEVDKKAYNIKFEEQVSLLGMEPGKKWAMVSNPFDKSLLRPAVGLAYAQALEIQYTPAFRLCKVWLNNDYMGVYTVMEPVEAAVDADQCAFLLERNISRSEDDKTYIDSSLGMRFEFNEPEEPSKMQVEQCRKMLAAAEDAICSGDYKRYEQLIDVDSFVDFYVFHEMIKDVDFGEYSTRYYFEDGVLHAGPPWDLDLTMGNVSTEKEEFKYASYNNMDGAGDVVFQVLNDAREYDSGIENATIDMSVHGLWAAAGDYYYWLCRDQWFMELVQQRWQAVRKITENLAVNNELGENLIDRYLTAYEEDLCGNFDRWSVGDPAHMSEWQEPADTYIENVEMLREWLLKRAAYLDSQFGSFMYLPKQAVQ